MSPAAAPNGAYCIATNGELPALPVLLIPATAGEEGPQRPGDGEQLRRCDAGSGLTRTDGAPGRGNVKRVIVYPE